MFNNTVFLGIFKKEMVRFRKKRQLRDGCQNITTQWLLISKDVNKSFMSVFISVAKTGLKGMQDVSACYAETTGTNHCG
jgi:hypothetical protein